jgi:hypothetical protein
VIDRRIRVKRKVTKLELLNYFVNHRPQLLHDLLAKLQAAARYATLKFGNCAGDHYHWALVISFPTEFDIPKFPHERTRDVAGADLAADAPTRGLLRQREG